MNNISLVWFELKYDIRKLSAVVVGGFPVKLSFSEPNY